ncbi:MAG TPA: response regulator [Anaeromyxobacteraceae bacterium]
MEPLPGITALAAVFDRARGARLDAAERFAVTLPLLFPEALVGCDIAWQARSGIVVVVMRFAERHFGLGARSRLDFWLARAGVRSADLGKVSAAQRAAFFTNFDQCEVRRTGLAPDQLFAGVAEIFTAAGALADRKQPPVTRPVLAMDVGGPGWEGVRYVAEEGILFLPGLLAPAEGDELTLSLRVPGRDHPLEMGAKVAWVRGSQPAGGPHPGFALALLDPPSEILSALGEQPPPPVLPAGSTLRAHPRYAVYAPVVVTAPATPPEAGEAPPTEAGAPLPLDPEAVEKVLTAAIEYASDQELAADYLENLSQGGAFVRTSHPSPVGTHLELSMRLPSGDMLSAPAVVITTSEKGMGVKFKLGEAAEQRLAAAIAHISARARRALVVDDDAVVRRMLQKALQQRGFEVLTADDGRTGLSMLSDELLALDLLVTDIRMPHMDGETFIRTIRRAGGECDLAIVAMTGSLDPEIEKRLEGEGADAVLDKALGPELIAQAADAVLERKRLARA